MRGLSAGIIAVCILTILATGFFARIRRSGGGGDVHIQVDTPSEAYRVMKGRGIRGETLVIMSKRLYFKGRPYKAFVPEGMGYPLRLFRLSDEVERSLTDKNFAWVSLEKRQARKIVHVLPREEFDKKIGGRGPAASRGRVDIPFFGAFRTIVSADSAYAMEPPVLFIDASFFERMGSDEAFRAIMREPRPFMVISCALEGDDSVADAQRDELREFVLMMEEGRG